MRLPPLLALVAGPGAVACDPTCPHTAWFAEPASVWFSSSCGFQSFSSTCADTDIHDHSVIATKTETCDVAFVLGDGTTHHAHLSLTDHPPTQKCGGSVFSLSAIIDGHATGELQGVWPPVAFSFSFGSDTDAGPATCRPDTGTIELKTPDSGADATSDASDATHD